MTQLKLNNCLYCSLLLLFMLFYQAGFAQYDFKKVDEWMGPNIADLDGRVILLIYKDGKVVYINDKDGDWG